MRIQTILNRVEKFKSFVYGEVRLEDHGDGLALVVQMEPRKNSRVFCSGCGRPGPCTIAWRNGGLSSSCLGDLGFLRLPDAAGELQAVRSNRRDGAMVRWQESTDDHLSLVSGDLGQEVELERGRLDFPHIVG